jgi:excisionase family DNA binding protein
MEKQILYSMTPAEMQSMIIDAVKAEFSAQDAHSDRTGKLKVVDSKQESYITAKEAAEYLGVHLITIHTWKSKGIIPSHRIHTNIRYKISELDAAMHSRKMAKS